MSRHYRQLLLIAVLAATARVLFFAVEQSWVPAVEANFILQSDSRSYHELAFSLLDGRFGNNEALRTPAYPAVIAVVYAITGPKPWVVLMLQCLLDSGTCFLIGLATSRRAGVFAAGFYALNPFAIFYANTLLSEPLLLFFLAAAMYLFRQQRYAATGTLLGFAALTKPIALYLPIIFALWLVASNRRAAALLLAAHLAVVMPWITRNYVTFGTLGFSTSSDYNLLILYASRIVAAHDGIPFRRAQERLHGESKRAAGAGVANPFTLAKHQRALAVQYFIEHPGLFVRSYVVGIIRMFANLNTRGVARALGVETEPLGVTDQLSLGAYLRRFAATRSLVHYTIAAITAVYLLALYATTAIGLSDWRRRSVFLAAAGYFILLTGSAGLARFGLPAFVFYLAVSGDGADRMMRRLTRQDAARR